MKRIWAAALLLASLPLIGLAQQGNLARQGTVLRENMPDDNSVAMPPAAPDDSVNSAPLPPVQEVQPGDTQPRMVPNPLDNPDANTAPEPSQQAQPQGQKQAGGWVQMGTATLQALDKVNARGQAITVKVGDTGHFGSLDIAVRGCYVRTPDRPADATAFLVIKDQHPDAPGFSGWMLRSAPSMSMLAHPIYDIRVTGCAQ
jgi:hypothetical protein